MSRVESTRQPKRQRLERRPFQQQQQEEEEGALLVAATAVDWLTLLSQELLICVLKYLEDFSDCARFSLASPRLGLTAVQNGLQLPRFQHPLFAVAMRLITRQAGAHGREEMRSSTLARRAEARAQPMPTQGGGAHSFTEAWVRKYSAGYAAASPDDFEWIKASSPELHIAQSSPELHLVQSPELHIAQSTIVSARRWHLVRGGVLDAKVRVEFADGTVNYYKGEKGAERLVRDAYANGLVQNYEGEKGAERLVRSEGANGLVQYYEGEDGAERVVRSESANGTGYFEGKDGAEHLVRAEFAEGTVVLYFEGEQDAERRIRAEFADGSVHYYEGEQGAERVVRAEFADGSVHKHS
jgi:hypothetical protein